MKHKYILPLTSVCLISSLVAKTPLLDTYNSQHSDQSNHNHFINPIGLMGSHTHKKGQWMFSYRYMSMDMDDNYTGSNRVSNAEVLNDFLVTPTDMRMEMHMFGAMYGVTDRLTIGAMVNFVDLEMNHLTRGGDTFRTESEGIGDTTINALYQFYQTESISLHAGLGIVLPTASTDEEDFLPPVGGVGVLPFPMQLGSGSWGLRPSLTYNGSKNQVSWGAQVMGQINLNDNDNSYRLGDSIMANIWGTYSFNQNFSASLRLQGYGWKNIDGLNDASPIPPVNMMGIGTVPTVDPDLRGGKRLDLFVGISYIIPGTSLRLAGEYGETLYQDLNGPQLGTDSTLNLGIQAIF